MILDVWNVINRIHASHAFQFTYYLMENVLIRVRLDTFKITRLVNVDYVIKLVPIAMESQNLIVLLVEKVSNE